MASSLSICMFQGFNLDQHSISDNLPVTFLLSLVICLILTVFSYNRRSIVTGAVVMTGASIFFFLFLMIRGITIRDELASPTVIYIYIIILYVTSIAVYLLGSARAGTAVLFAMGSYLIAGLKYLEFESRILYLVLFAAAAIMEFAFLEYYRSALKSVLYRPDFTRFGLSSSALAAAALGIAALLFFAVIVPMNPGAKDITLLTKHIAIENLQVTGIMDQYPVEDPELHTDLTDESAGRQKAKDEGGSQNTENGAENSDQSLEGGNADNGSGAGNRGNGRETAGTAITYQRNINKPALFIILVLALMVASVMIKLLQRRLWMKRIRKKAPEEQIVMLYLGLLNKFRYLGMERRPEDTPSVYAARHRRQLKFLMPGKTDFSRMTGLFLRIRYGQFHASERDCREFYRVYRDFYRNSRAYLGNLRYAGKFFFL